MVKFQSIEVMDLQGLQIKMNLNNYKFSVTSENGEDGIIKEIFKRIGTKNKYCVEFGACDGYTNSNTWDLVTNEDWNAVYIESNKEYFKKLQNEFKDNDKVTCLNMKVEIGGKNELDYILDNINIPVFFDLLSIDIDGNDYHIWESLTYRPRVVIIESNPTIPPNIDFICPMSSEAIGSSAKSLVELGKRKGYELVAHTGNCIFVLKEEFDKLGIKDNSLENLFDYSKLIYLMNTFDGRKFQIGKDITPYESKFRKWFKNIYKTLFRKDYVKDNEVEKLLEQKP